jgi:hypothetical protein
LKRTPLRRKSRPVDDRVTPELHQYVLERDKSCCLSWWVPGHQCFTQWGERHDADDLSKLTTDHVWPVSAVKGKRAPSIPGCLIAMCGLGNISAPSHEIREKQRDHLRKVEAA